MQVISSTHHSVSFGTLSQRDVGVMNNSCSANLVTNESAVDLHQTLNGVWHHCVSIQNTSSMVLNVSFLLLGGLCLIKVTARALCQFFACSPEQSFSENVFVSTHEFTSVGGIWHTQYPWLA